MFYFLKNHLVYYQAVKFVVVQDASSFQFIVDTLSCLIASSINSTDSLHNSPLPEHLYCFGESLVTGIDQVGVLSFDSIAHYDFKLGFDTRNYLHYCNLGIFIRDYA